MAKATLRKWLQIQLTYDPDDVFPGYKGFHN